MKKGLAILLLLAESLAALAQDAVVVSDRQLFRMKSSSSGEWQVEQRFRVNNKEGLDAAVFMLYTDSFRSLSSFSGTVADPSGKTTRLKQADILGVSYSEGLVDDGKYYYYRPSQTRFPLEVTYSYTVSFKKGITSFPSFFPVPREKTDVEEACFTLDVPEGETVKQCSSGMQYSFSTVKGRDLHVWEVKGVKGIAEESLMPPLRKLVPFVYSSPSVIELGGYKGRQDTWKEIGAWLFSMQKGALEVPQELAVKVREMTADCTTTLEKLSVLYDYLRKCTRYVSIQLGIGGLKPMPAREVGRMGFGDCKGLSNYLKALLSVADVPSDYYIISTTRKDLLPDYASVGQMDHVMLAVPLPELKDTAWVECTNPILPLGYRHDDAAGHEVVLVKEDGGERVRIPAYPDSLSRRILETRVALNPDGSASLSLSRTLYLDYFEPYLDFAESRYESQVRQLSAAMKLQVRNLRVKQVADNFSDYARCGRSFVPWMRIGYDLETPIYANASAGRLFVPLNPVAQVIPYQKGTRVNDIWRENAFEEDQHILLALPEGFEVESIPDDVTLDTEWGYFFSSARPAEGAVEIRQRLVMRRCDAPASRYDDFRRFARAVNKAYDATIVLRKAE